MFSGVVSNACTFLFKRQELVQALYYLEKGRVVILGKLMDDRRFNFV